MATSASETDPIGTSGTMTEHLRANLKGKENQLKALEQTSNVALGLFITIILFAVAFLLWGATTFPQAQWKTALSSLALSLIATLAYAIVYFWMVEKRRNTAETVAFEIESLRQQIFTHQLTATVSETVLNSGANVAEQVNAKIHKLLNEEATRLVEQWPALLPADYFPASTEPDKRFQNELINAIRQSTRYSFRGSTGRYVIRTLLKANPQHTRCSILIMDPTNENTLRLYARSRLGANDSDAELKNQMIQLREEIYTTIVSLFDHAQRFNLTFRLTSDPLFYRSEVLNDCAFVSFYTGNERNINPETYRYDRLSGGSTYFIGFNKDADLVWDVSRRGLDSPREASEEKLKDLLVSLGASEFGDVRTQIDYWREKARKTYLDLGEDSVQ